MSEKPTGLEDVVVGPSSICEVNGIEGKLSYRGYDNHDLATYSTFEEVCYLLWFGELPSTMQLRELKDILIFHRQLPQEIYSMIRAFPPYAAPMEVLRTAVSALASFDRSACIYNRQANMCQTMRLTSQIPAIVAAHHRIRNGLDPVPARTDLGHAANFLYMLTGREPNEHDARIFDIALILHADHELNASTFAARVAAATLADMYSAITAAIGTLAGPLHGGANQAVLEMLREIGDIDRVEAYIDKALAEKRRIPGFGHRVYRTEDPRATHLRRMSRELAERTGNTKWYNMSCKIEELMKAKKGLNPNVDFYSATVYHALGIPADLFTPVFAISRISGWTAHVLEQYQNNRLIRPRAEYVGHQNRPYIPIGQRDSMEVAVPGTD